MAIKISFKKWLEEITGRVLNLYKVLAFVCTVTIFYFLLIISAFTRAHSANVLEIPLPNYFKRVDIEYINQDEIMINAVSKLNDWLQTKGMGISIETIASRVSNKTSLSKKVFTIEFTEPTLKTILNSLIGKDPRYTWDFKDNVIRIFPKDIRIHPEYILDKKISKFSAHAATPFKIRHKIYKLTNTYTIEASVLPRKSKKSTKTVDISLTNVTVRKILNILVQKKVISAWAAVNELDKTGMLHTHIRFFY